jgi:hypothetical protein
VPVHPNIVLFEIKENPFFCCSFVGLLTAHCQIEKKTTTHRQCPGELEMSEKRRLLEAAQLLCLNSNKTNIFQAKVQIFFFPFSFRILDTFDVRHKCEANDIVLCMYIHAKKQ